jgi:hypothetical protein
MSDTHETPETLKRLNLNLPSDRFSRIQDLARKRGTTVADFVRSALGLMETVETEVRNGHRIGVLGDGDQVLKQLIFPL